MNQSLDKKWFVAQIKPNSYQTAIQNLERQGFETFLPKMEITQRQKNRFLVKNVYVFPGYMFVCFDPHIIDWVKINSTYGVSKILAFNKKPSEISSDLILELKIRYEINSNSTQKEKLQKGDSIKFSTGPFADLIAKVESVDERHRIWVLLESMGGNQRLKLHNAEKNQYSKFHRSKN
jgi:transcriptional antiterminator RfaH